MEMVNLTDHPEDTSQKVKLPVIWHSYATGLLFENSKYNMQLTLDAVNQAFDQSPLSRNPKKQNYENNKIYSEEKVYSGIHDIGPVLFQ